MRMAIDRVFDGCKTRRVVRGGARELLIGRLTYISTWNHFQLRMTDVPSTNPPIHAIVHVKRKRKERVTMVMGVQ